MMGSGDRNPGHPPPSVAGDGVLRPVPVPGSDPCVPLLNLSILGRKMESLRRFLSDAVDGRTPLATADLRLVSSEIASAVHHVILNGAALLASSSSSLLQDPAPAAQIGPIPTSILPDPPIPPSPAPRSTAPGQKPADPRPNPAPDEGEEEKEEEDEEECEIVEMDTAELVAEHVHFCEICGKGFKRDANLRMHMRAHGNQFKTLEALSSGRPHTAAAAAAAGKKIRFSCPFPGCNRNRAHRRFRPLKSVVCVKNHFKRTHCPKMFACHRCNKKSFAVVADLRSHLKHCGESQWRCSCGTSFSRKDKLFGHVALFEGHMPAVEVAGEEKATGCAAERGKEEEMGGVEQVGCESLDPEFFEGLLEELEGIKGYWPVR